MLSLLIGMIILHGALWWNSAAKLRAGYQDFAIFYAAGKIVAQHSASHLYDLNLQYSVEREFAPNLDIRKGPLPYNHPPAEALLFVPLASLPFWDAYVVWIWVNVAALAASIFILRRHLPNLRGRPALLALAGLAFFPIFVAVLQGQDALLLMLIFALAYAAFERNTDFAGGCWLGLGMFRFHLVLPFVFVLLLRKAWRALGGFALVASLFTIASVAVVGWKQFLDYPAFVLWVETRTIGPIVPKDMPNLHGLLATFLPSIASGKVGLLVIAGLSLVLLWYASSCWKQSKRMGLGFSTAVIATLMASYHAYEYDLSLLFVPVLLMADYELERNDGRNWMVVVPMILLFLTPLHILLWWRLGVGSVLAVIPLLWFWGIGLEISRVAQLRNGELRAVT